MICVKFTAFCDLRANLRIRLAALRKSLRKFWFWKLALACVDLRVRSVWPGLHIASKGKKTAFFNRINQVHNVSRFLAFDLDAFSERDCTY